MNTELRRLIQEANKAMHFCSPAPDPSALQEKLQPISLQGLAAHVVKSSESWKYDL